MEEKKIENEKKVEEKKIRKDPNEFLFEPLTKLIEDAWSESYLDPKAETYKLYKYLNLSLAGVSFLDIYFKPREGYLTLTRKVKAAPRVGIGFSALTYAGIKGNVIKSHEIEIGTRYFLILEQKTEIEKVLTELYKAAQEEGLKQFKYYIKHPEKTVPDVLTKGISTKEIKYFNVVKNPREQVEILEEIPPRMYDVWEKRIGREFIEDASIVLKTKEEFDIPILKTKDLTISGIQKETRFTVEGMLELKDVGEVLEAIGCAGGIEGLIFTHPYTLEKSRGIEAIEALGEWVGEKGQKLLRAEKPEEFFPERTINVVMPGTILAASISYFFSGKKMWESIENNKDLQRLVGQRVAPLEFDMLIDGRQKTSWGENLYGSLEIDSEGTLAREKEIIKNGKLIRFFNSRLYFLPIAETTALKDTLLSEEDPLTATARKELPDKLHDTVPTNLYVKPSGNLTLDELVNKLPKEKNHLYVASASISKVDLDKKNISLRVDMGSPIVGGKINKDVTIGKMTLNIDFNSIAEKLKYMGGPQTVVTHPFNMEVEGKIYEISVTAPYVALFEVKREDSYYGEETEDQLIKNLFTSQHLWTEALPRYLTDRRAYLLQRDVLAAPERVKTTGIIFPPIVPKIYTPQPIERLEPV
jgi:hypothetical protein